MVEQNKDAGKYRRGSRRSADGGIRIAKYVKAAHVVVTDDVGVVVPGSGQCDVRYIPATVVGEAWTGLPCGAGKICTDASAARRQGIVQPRAIGSVVPTHLGDIGHGRASISPAEIVPVAAVPLIKLGSTHGSHLWNAGRSVHGQASRRL